MFARRLKVTRAMVRACLASMLTREGALMDAMRYSLTGGKGLRGFLVMESARIHSVSAEHSVWPAAAIEAIHAYSLVHDDLPCMDDDDLRRGLPTVHVKWDQATAVLVGDALQTLAFELLTRTEIGDATTRIALISALARASGRDGMVLGQVQDIAAESAKAPLTLTDITILQANKTGALIRWSAEAGALLAGADPTPMQDYASALGLAFQIADDILDVEGDPEKTGKRVGKDAGAGKATFVSLFGLDGAKARAQAQVDQACDALAPYGAEADTLRQAARFVIAREM